VSHDLTHTDAQQREFAINIASSLHRDVITSAAPGERDTATDPADAVVESAKKIYAWLTS
jgi:hypothetical protein